MRLGIFAGGFKPFTTGHYAKFLLSVNSHDTTLILCGLGSREKGAGINFTREMATRQCALLKRAAERRFPHQVVVAEGLPSPIASTFSILGAIKSINGGNVLEAPPLSSLPVDVHQVHLVTVFGGEGDLDVYTKHIGTSNEEKYYGTLIQEKMLQFVTGHELDDSLDVSQRALTACMRQEYPGLTDEELSMLIEIRASEVRSYATQQNWEAVDSYLPNLYSFDERTQIMKMLGAR